MRPAKKPLKRWPSEAASIDLPDPPPPTNAKRVGAAAVIV
jgi:hypothetical protein